MGSLKNKGASIQAKASAKRAKAKSINRTKTRLTRQY